MFTSCATDVLFCTLNEHSVSFFTLSSSATNNYPHVPFCLTTRCFIEITTLSLHLEKKKRLWRRNQTIYSHLTVSGHV